MCIRDRSGANNAPIYLFASDTGFIGSHGYTLRLDGNSTGTSAVTGGAWGGSSNNALDFANMFSTVGPLSTPSFNGMATAAMTPAVSPYSLTVGVAITRSGAGTTTGDLNLSVPEPASITLFGLGLLGTAFSRRRRQA